MNFKNSVIALGMMTTLGACLGGDDGGGLISGGIINIEGVIALSERAAEAIPAVLEELPATATMSGLIVVSADGDETEIIGNMNVIADFDNAVLTGSATNIGEYEISDDCVLAEDCNIELVQELSGQLDLDGTIDGTDFSGDLTGEISGTFTDDDIGSGQFTGVVSLTAGGSFGQDDDGLMAVADLEGDVELELTIDGETVTETQDLDGTFIVAE
ncbi:MAG: hypothetical protein ACI82I_002225 [Gammaproteobacteria bacterium]|jgi:hypothetical protein